MKPQPSDWYIIIPLMRHWYKNLNSLARNANSLITSLSFADLLSLCQLFPLCQSTLAYETCSVVSFLDSSDTWCSYSSLSWGNFPTTDLFPLQKPFAGTSMSVLVIKSHSTCFVGRFCHISPTQVVSS